MTQITGVEFYGPSAGAGGDAVPGVAQYSLPMWLWNQKCRKRRLLHGYYSVWTKPQLPNKGGCNIAIDVWKIKEKSAVYPNIG